MTHLPHRAPALGALLWALVLSACGGAGGDGARVRADPQGIDFAAAPGLQVAASARVQASASSGLPVSYGSLTPAVCAVDAATGIVTGLSIGSCSIAANQRGDDGFAPAPQATQSFAVTGRSQAIVFDAPPTLSAGTTALLHAEADSGLAVRYGSLTPATCTVDPDTGSVSGVAGGSCTVTADQAGDTQWAPAARATLALTVDLRVQTLEFASLPALQVGTAVNALATASSGLPVSFASLTPDVCSVAAGSAVVTAVAAGTCTIAADQAGDARWARATQALKSTAVTRATQSIAFGAAPAALTVGGTATVRASASSGLAVSYTSLTPATCSVNGNGLVTSLVAGTCTIAANQAGDARWAPAAQATQALSTGRASQSIAFGSAPSLTVGSSASVRATASSGLAVGYTSLTTTICSVEAAGGTVIALASGSCTIAADQAGDAYWAPAAQATQTLSVAGKAQSISFGAAPALSVGASATVRAVASSGLAVAYSSLTSSVCTVVAASGAVTGLAVGQCRIAADQPGNATWAAAAQIAQTLTVGPDPNQTIRFATAPTLTLGGTARVQATASSGLAVAYSSLSAGVCSVQAGTGLVAGLALGDCVIAADQAGNASYNPAPQVTQTLPVQLPVGVTAPAAPRGVTARLGQNTGTVVVDIGSVDSGGSPITGYTVVSRPAGITASAAATPVTVGCASGCAGYAFSIYATNAVGPGSSSATVDIVTTFDVVSVFREPDTQPRDTVFAGSFALNSTSGAITGLAGRLTESMTGNAVGSAPYYDMTQVPLVYQLKSWHDDALGGTFVASFAKNTTSTFATVVGGDGWSPQAGVLNGGVYAGFPAKYATSVQNSSILVFVPDNPFAPLTAGQIARLAYADCAPGGMMGAVCMTATSVAGYGAVGTMSGYPVSQLIVKR